MAAWRYEISLLVLKNISLVRIIQHSKRNFVSPRGHVISSIAMVSNILNLYLRLAIKQGQGRRGLCGTLSSFSKVQPAKTAVSHRSSPLGTFRVSCGGTSATERQKFHTDDVINVYIIYPVVMGFHNQIYSILRFSWSILLKCVFICERAPAKIKCFFQRRICSTNFDCFALTFDLRGLLYCLLSFACHS